MVTRLGLIGRGSWGRNIERTLLSFRDVSLVVVERGEPPRRDLDGILVATPSETHADVALPYIEAGIATFIEKPMVTSVADAHRIQEAAIGSRGAVFVGHIQRYNPAFLVLLELLPAIGGIRYVLCEDANSRPRINCSVLWDWLPHDLSMAHAIFGVDPISVQAWPLTASSTCQAAVSRSRYGEVSLISTVSWLSPIRSQRLTITAERGTLIFDDKAKRKLVLYDLDGNTSYPGYDDELPLTRELRAFLKFARSECSDQSHVALGTSIARTIAAAEESIVKGTAIDIQA
jgi:UDP-N-acetylglucosamine 3-dehydrogenase